MAISAPCGCLSEGDENSNITAHRDGCGFLEDLLARSGTDDPWTHLFVNPAPDPEPSDAEKALAASYERYAGQLAEIEALRAGRQLPSAP
jgi:hypothetical protein